MNTTLTIQERLKDLRVEKGLTLEQLEKQTGISKSALGNYETDDYKDISHVSIVALAKFYGVSADYLLGFTESKNHPGAELSELQLSDGMIEVLKSKNFNIRLLCEMAEHKEFVKLMADMEIYVDGIVSRHVQSINSMVDLIRDEIIERYKPEKSDNALRTLEAANIDEDGYFCYRIYEDLAVIIKDIKEAHKKDSTSASTTPIVEDMKLSLTKAAAFKGSKQEKQAVFLLLQMGIDYRKLTPVEFTLARKMFSRSTLLKSPGNMRGKS